jgi:uncharacterized protein DUF4339
MDGLPQLLVMVCFGIACASIGTSRGRSGPVWFALGVIFTCFALVLVLVLPDLNELAEKDERQSQKTRRLREELAQERNKNQSFRGHVKARLDIHDAALEIDTREQELPVELPAPPAIPDPVNFADLPQEGWFIAIPGSDAQGPYTLAALEHQIRAGDLNARTLIWNADHVTDWASISDSPLADLLA